MPTDYSPETQVKTDAYRKLWNAVDSVYERGSEAYRSNAAISYKQKRNQFYEHLYIHRKEADAMFDSFLESENTILVLSGHLGIGKTTFIRNQFENRQICNGVIVDLNLNPKEFNDIEFGTVVRSRISKAIREHLKHNYDTRLRHNIKLNDMVDLTYTTEEFDPPDFSHFTLEHAEIELTARILTFERFMESEELDEIRSMFSDNITLDDSLDERITKYKICLKNALSARKRVLDALTCPQWIMLYQLHFRQTDIPTVIAIDNIDAIETRVIAGDVLTEMITLRDSIVLHNDAALAIGLTLPKSRLVFTVRDENTFLVRVNGTVYKHIRQMPFILQRGQNLMDKNIVDKTGDVDTTPAFLTEVVRARVAYINRELADQSETEDFDELVDMMELYQTVMDQWFQPADMATGALAEEWASINIFNLNNSSIRAILEHVFWVSTDIVRCCVAKGIDSESFRKYFGRTWIRGHIVRRLWALPSSRSLSMRLSDEFIEKGRAAERHDDFHLSLTRVVLTILVAMHRRDTRLAMTPAGIFDIAQSYVPDVTEAAVREVIFDLYEGAVRQNEFVSIMQNGPVGNCPESIDDDAEIRATPRGLEVLSRAMISLDHFGDMLPKDALIPMEDVFAPLAGEMRKVLTGMAVSEACQYVLDLDRMILKPMEINYKRACESHIFKAIADRNRDRPDTNIVDIMAEEGILLGDDFYIQRAFNSCITAIEVYIKEALKGTNCCLLVSEQERAKMVLAAQEAMDLWGPAQKVKWTEIMQRGPEYHIDDTTMDELLMVMPATNPLWILWDYAKKYRTIYEEFSSYKNLRVSDIPSEEQEDAV
jgi:hypothetical protein